MTLFFLGHPSITASVFTPDIIEIRAKEKFSEFLTGEKYWNLKIFNHVMKTPEFLLTEPRDRKLLFDLFIAELSEVSFQDNVMTIRIKGGTSWDEAFPKISKIFEEHTIILNT